jgi:hypothetical protein
MPREVTSYEKQLEEQVEKLQEKLASLEHAEDERKSLIKDMVTFSADFLGETQDEISIKNNLPGFVKNYPQKVPDDILSMWNEIINLMQYNTENVYGEKEY